MRWDIDTNMRCDIIAFSGVNFSGRRTTMQIYPSSKKGDFNDGDIRSCTVIAPLGTRVIFCASSSEEDWEASPWRAVEIVKGVAYKGRASLPMVRIPDLQKIDKTNVERTDPDYEESYPEALTLAEGQGKGWTYGRVGPLHGIIGAVKVSKIP